MPKKRSKSSTETANRNLSKRKAGGRSHASTNPDRPAPGKTSGPRTSHRSAATIRLLRMYNSRPDTARMHEVKTQPARIEPDRRWFGNVKTADPQELDRLRAEHALKPKDPYQFLLRTKRTEAYDLATSPSLRKRSRPPVQPGEPVGPRRKRPRLGLASVAELAAEVAQREQHFDPVAELAKREAEAQPRINPRKQLEAGQSKRIWEELFKVVDASDIVVFVLDARDPQGTRCPALERHLAKNCRLKHVLFVLNKSDLVPSSVAAGWVRLLSTVAPTVAFRADPDRAFGRDALLGLLRQFDAFHRDKKTVSAGFVGYPNVGKSSVINSLKRRAACKAAPIPGETRVWQYVALTSRIYLIDCPGVVPPAADTPAVLALRGALRAERLDEPELYAHELIRVAGAELLAKVYGVEPAEPDELLAAIARRLGKLRRGGEPDVEVTARMMLMDWQRGDIPHHAPVPETLPS